MSKKYKAPRYLENKTRSVIEIPFVQTSGAPGNRYEWNNGAHAAIHSILAGLIHAKKKKALRYWLETAQSQLGDAVECIKKPHAKVMPTRQNNDPMDPEILGGAR